MNKKEKREEIRFMIFCYCLFTSIFFLCFIIYHIPNFVNFYENKMYPSYVSHIANCPTNENTTEILEKMGYKITAYVNVSTSQVVYIDEPDIETIKHEFIHIKQKERGASNSCFFPIDYLHELEAYIGQDLSDEKFIKIYGNYSN